MSLARQTVVLTPSFKGCGNRPSRTPCHHPDRETGIIGGIGGSELGSPMMCLMRK
jgi:hypothetical protein